MHILVKGGLGLAGGGGATAAIVNEVNKPKEEKKTSEDIFLEVENATYKPILPAPFRLIGEELRENLTPLRPEIKEKDTDKPETKPKTEKSVPYDTSSVSIELYDGEVLEFKPIEGKSRLLWMEQETPQGICAREADVCEWSDLLRTQVPMAYKARMEVAVRSYAELKCSSIPYAEMWTNDKGQYSCFFYGKDYKVESVSLYQLNFTNLVTYLPLY